MASILIVSFFVVDFSLPCVSPTIHVAAVQEDRMKAFQAMLACPAGSIRVMRPDRRVSKSTLCKKLKLSLKKERSREKCSGGGVFREKTGMGLACRFLHHVFEVMLMFWLGRYKLFHSVKLGFLNQKCKRQHYLY